MSDLHFSPIPDGLPTDANGNEKGLRSGFVDALKTMEGLPVWLLSDFVRMNQRCATYNQLDSLLNCPWT
jgi:hypothetical protein